MTHVTDAACLPLLADLLTRGLTLLVTRQTSMGNADLYARYDKKYIINVREA